MEIAMLIADSPGPDAEGGVRAPLQLAGALDAVDGVRVDVYKTASAADATLREEYGVDLVRMPSRLGAKALADRLSPLPAKYNTPLIGCSIPRKLRSREYDVLNVNNSMILRSFHRLVELGAETDTTTVITAHGVHELFNQPDLLDMGALERLLYRATILPVYRRSLRRADGVVTLSEEARRTVRTAVPDVANVYVSSNGVVPDARVPSPDRSVIERYDLTPPLVLYVGGLQRTKGIEDAVALSHEIEAGSLAIVGSDTDDMYDSVAAAVDPGVARILGYVPTADLRQLYALADLLFYPTRSDNFPLVVLEAMTNGTPVVATDVGAIRREVGDAGVVVDRREELIDAAIALLDDPDRREELGRAARSRVDDLFTWEAVAGEHLEIYGELLGR